MGAPEMELSWQSRDPLRQGGDVGGEGPSPEQEEQLWGGERRACRPMRCPCRWDPGEASLRQDKLTEAPKPRAWQQEKSPQ